MGSFRIVVCAVLVGQVAAMFLLPAGNMVRESKEAVLANTALKYFITGYKDSKGHWTEEVKVEHMGDEDWHMELDHSKVEVENGQPKVQITASLSAASKKENKKATIKEAEYDGIFKMFPKSHKDWYGAQMECLQWGGNLAIPDTKNKLDKMTAILNEHNRNFGSDSAAFVGFSDIDHEGYFVTIFGEPMFSQDMSAWSPHWFNAQQPDNDKSWSSDGEDCGSLRPDGGLNDVPCRYNLPAICEIPRAKREPNSPPEDAQATVSEDDSSEYTAPLPILDYVKENYYGDCDYDFDDDNNNNNGIQTDSDESLILFPSSDKDWFAAKEDCESWGAHLAVPDTEQKVLKMAEMLRSVEKNPGALCAFVGFSDIQEEGDFLTIFGKPLFDPKSSWTPRWFKENQPDDDKSWTSQGEDCGSLHPNGGLNDVPCNYRLPYICEKSTQRTTTSRPVSTIEEDKSTESGEQVQLEDKFNGSIEQFQLEDKFIESSEQVQLEDKSTDTGDQVKLEDKSTETGDRVQMEDKSTDTGDRVQLEDKSSEWFEDWTVGWMEAKRKCEAWGGILFMTDSPSELTVLKTRLYNADVPLAFLESVETPEQEKLRTTTEPPIVYQVSRADDELPVECSLISGKDVYAVPCGLRLTFLCNKVTRLQGAPEEEVQPSPADSSTVAPSVQVSYEDASPNREQNEVETRVVNAFDYEY